MPKFSFAHLMGLGRAPAPAADTSDETDENEKDKTDDEGDDGDETEAEGAAAQADAVAKAAAEAVTAERHRCASIFALPAAANNVAQAAELAFNTDLSVEQASKVLGTAPKAGKDRLDLAMTGRSPNLGTDRAAETSNDEKSISAGWNRAVELANKQLGLGARK
jgi:hypothetical protein